MDPVNVGILSILPPIIAIALALLTKEVISSLIIGILSGTLIYSIASGLNPIIGTVETTFNLMTGRMDVGIILFLCLLGALVVVTGMAGGSRAYGRWAASKIKGKRSAMLATGALGILIFIDDYFNCLTVGTVMKPVTDKYGISRSKLSYIIDATAAPICIIAPISSWAAAVGSNIAATGMYESELSAFIATIPFNLYAILSLVMVAFLCISKLDFGPMRKAELKAAKGDLGAVDTNIESEYEVSSKGTIWDMLVPVIALIVFSVLEMLYTGGLWGDDPAYHSLAAAFGNCSPTPSLIVGGFAALVVAFVMYIPRKVVSFRDFMNGITIGVKSMVPACIILTLAWTISGVCRELLMTGEYVSGIVAASALPAWTIPAIVFAIAAFLSFSMGTAWGTFGILIPIIVPVCAQIAPELTIVALSATLAGSVFGDHCSPISDTTILSSTGAGCVHMEHVSTQLPYALTVAVCCFLGYIVSGLCGGNPWITLGAGLAIFAVAMVIMLKLGNREVKKA
ncbi:MAG: Na+/H+ antiporter NhaC family protein [Clostridiales bacterium]|nr:Na+/H+ antiporter NhaC family protein [Clostridiales bacterium]